MGQLLRAGDSKELLLTGEGMGEILRTGEGVGELLQPEMSLRRNPSGNRVISGQKSCTRII